MSSLPDPSAAKSSAPASPVGTPQVGDLLVVTGGYYAREPREGRVTAVRRKYMTIELPRGRGSEKIDFEVATGFERLSPNGNGHYARRARTREQVEYDQRLVDAGQVLKSNGLSFGLGRRTITDEQVFAIAELLQPEVNIGDAGAHDATSGEVGQ